MDDLQIPSSCPSRLTQRSAPDSPIRHIHSSFPYYFYSTPSTPNSEGGLSAFVTLCESRLHESGTKPTSSDSNLLNSSISFNCPPVALATADDLFHNGKLLPIEPLKLPPRLQYVANVRKSLRSTQSFRHRRPTELNADPFAVAIETVTKEGAPWCQISKNHHHQRAKSYENIWHELDPMCKVRDMDNNKGSEGEHACKKRRPILSYFRRGSNDSRGPTKLDPNVEGSNSGKSRASPWEKKARTIVENIRRVTKGKETSDGDDVCSKRVRILAKYRQSYNQLTVMACLGF